MNTFSRLRWPFKALLIALPVIAFSYFAINDGWFAQGDDSQVDRALTGGPSTEMPAPTPDDPAAVQVKGREAKVSESRMFAYQPEKPVDGKLKGVVEVGATGFNSFVVNMDKNRRWEVVSKDFGQSLAYEGLATTEDIRAGLKKYISMMFEMGFVVNLVTPEQEGKLALKSALPESYYGTAFVTDIGSGNTKISWMNAANIVAEEAPGSKYFEKEKTDASVYDEVKSKAGKVPQRNREVCFIIGGTPYDLAKQHRNGEERYTVLHAPGSYAADKPKTKSGLNIYKAIQDATGCDTFVFDWDANFSIGFLLQLPY